MTTAFATRTSTESSPYQTREETVELVFVTVSMAQAMMRRNKDNRRLRVNTARKYTNAMKVDLWHLSPDCLAEGKDGRLMNGQHRLQAVIDSGKGQWFVLLRNVDEATFRVMDQGMGRSMADSTGLSTKDVATIKQALYGPKQSQTGTPYRIIIQSPELMQALGTGLFADALTLLNTHIPMKEISRFPAPVRAVLFRAALHFDKAPKLGEIITALAYGANLEVGNPLLTLRNDFERGARSRHSQQGLAKMYYHKTQRALEAYFTGEKLMKIHYGPQHEPVELIEFPEYVQTELEALVQLG